MKFKTTTFNWNNGIVESKHFFFELEQDAIAFARTVEAYSVKIYNEIGELIHEIIPDSPTTYA